MSSTALIVAIAVGVAICMLVSWWKRRAIAAGARRASAVVVRASVKLRRSISQRLGHAPMEEDAPDVNVDVHKITSDSH